MSDKNQDSETPATAQAEPWLGAKMEFSVAVDCVGNLLQEFKDARKPGDGKATLTLSRGEMDDLRLVYYSLKAAREAVKASEALVEARQYLENLLYTLQGLPVYPGGRSVAGDQINALRNNHYSSIRAILAKTPEFTVVGKPAVKLEASRHD